MTAPVADVVFDLPLDRAFSYLIPAGVTVAPGQRVRAPLQGRPRLGVVVTVGDRSPDGLRPLLGPVEGAPVFSPAMLDVARRVASESLSTLGSTLAALSPPPGRQGVEVVAPPPDVTVGSRPTPPELWVDGDREARLVETLARERGAALVVTPDVEIAARWARRLDAARLDSGAPDEARRAAWFGAARGRPRIVVGTRSALLAPLPPPAALALIDEHDPAHKPPGAPRLHSRDIIADRAAREGARLLLLSATPSVETWERAQAGGMLRPPAPADAWPDIVTADTRGILRNHPLTLPLTRAIEAAARGAGQIALILARDSAAIGCDDCGAIVRCPDCGVAQGASRATRSVECRLCGRRDPLPDVCAACGGHRLSTLGWSAERVEAALRKRFPGVSVARAGRGEPAAATSRATVLIGTASLLRGIPRRSLAAAAFVALDSLLRQPDFRAGERAFQGLWAAAEAVRADGRVIVQTLHPEHYAVRAVAQQDHDAFYGPELGFRAELGYPPYRRLCLVTVSGAEDAAARALVDDCVGALRGIGGLDVYPPIRRGAPAARRPRWSVTIKGPRELPALVAEPLRPLRERRRRRAGMVEVEVDPVSWG